MNDNSKILCIETSSDACSVALNCGAEILEYYELAPCKHSQLILPMIQKLLAETGYALTQLDALAFGCGPGSFTGIRLATSTVQGLALGLDIPVVPISTLNIMAQGVYEEYKTSNVLVSVDAKMGGIYLGAYDLGADGLMQEFFADKLIQLDQVGAIKNIDKIGDCAEKEWCVIGDAWEISKNLLTQNFKIVDVVQKIYPRAKYLASLARQNFSQGKTVSADQALPIYLREQVVSV